MSEPNALILLPRLQVQNANAISGPLTWGFPSPTAFSGFVHALERQLSEVLEKGFSGVGIICHKFEPQIYKAGMHTHVLALTRNPLSHKKDKDGNAKPSSFMEEGRAHIEVSLLLALLDSIDSDEKEYFAQQVMGIVHGMRLAGGSILPQRSGNRYEVEYVSLSQGQEEQDKIFSKLRRRLLPGFALVQREDRLEEHLIQMRKTEAQANALDALLDLTRLNIDPDHPNPGKPEEKQWGIRTHSGWLAPIPVGYAAISPLYQAGEVRNARDSKTPFLFVESLYSLGEWVSPHRLTTLQQLLWHQQADVETGIYRCINRYADFVTDTNIIYS